MSFFNKLLANVDSSTIEVTEYAPQLETINAYKALEEGKGNSLIRHI